MRRIGFDNDRYLKMQSEHITERIAKFGGKLYLEFGGKLFDDFHASRVLPGFHPDSKVQMLVKLKEDVEIIIVINAGDIEKSKKRGDLGITYDLDVLRLFDAFRSVGLYVSSVVITRYKEQPSTVAFEHKLQKLGIQVYHHYDVEGYPRQIEKVVSEEGLGRNDYIQTTRRLVVVTAPGPGSGKMATCLSQLYHEHKRGIRAGYAKFETFPIWNLPLEHPVNLAYEAATADLDDVNMIDPFHLNAYGEIAVNYNRDVETFPLLSEILTRIAGESPYRSPTDMGVNMVGNCITDNEAVSEAACQEVVRRYYTARCGLLAGEVDEAVVTRLETLMGKMHLSADNRPVIAAALAKAEQTDAPAAALELPDGTIVTGKTSSLLGAASAMLLNALKASGGVPDDLHLISPIVIEPIQDLKVNHLGNHNPRLHTDETLIALSISAATNPLAELAMQQLEKLRGCEAHSTVILSSVDEGIFRKLGINITAEPQYQTKKLYHR